MTVFIGRAGVAAGVSQRKTNAPSVIFGFSGAGAGNKVMVQDTQ